MALLDRFKGFYVVLSQMLQPPVTRQYPKEPRKMTHRFRGIPVLVTDPETGEEKCTACGLCATACPNNVITMTSEPHATKGRHPVTYNIQALRCLFCGLCVEACPVKAIQMSHHFELASTSRDNLLYDKQRLLELGRGIYDEVEQTESGEWIEVTRFPEEVESPQPKREVA
ncbi:NADH-quinone oxidoreductase, chain I [Thermobaculum terrenum ATCC BAA-798]|mgnify:CR=1 FL=1|uniref:NADH-quinone oxidoreductase subunit I n=1 Tax=Thermobaculum terrenum (strain ATCC BAA-798 / CCMEE 7001 / YNP1) TaxID=525904 RepID=D1CCC7_THET1|nr:NADH-quinone oxidoreductase subunit I [Thermobaculum terrenum]ACZ42442.1 NADH-quinone oxidoreductase, chain I [Thermobaculum terrenum ATCC BAA-798]